jgi:hypothetical protein
MKTFKKLTIFFTIMLFGFMSLQGDQHQNPEDIDYQIWKLEEKYWDYWIKADIDGYLSLLHEDFIGWPSSLDTPRDKNAAREFVLDYLAQSKPFAFEIKPAGISVITNVSIVHYHIISKDEEGNQIGDRFRITHTWIKVDGNWKVMGGMSSKSDD